MSTHLLHHIPEAGTARAAWLALAAAFGGAQQARLVQTKREFSLLHKQQKETISQYYARACELRNRILQAGGTVSDAELTLQLLTGLPPAFDAIVELLSDRDNATLPEVVARLQTTEQRISRHQGMERAERAAAQALLATTRPLYMQQLRDAVRVEALIMCGQSAPS